MNLNIIKQSEVKILWYSKDTNLIIFQSPFRVKLFREYNDDIFVDGTFFIAPKFSYQIFIKRTYAKELDCFYTTSFAILKNKEQETYKILFEKLKKIANTCNNNIIIAESLNSYLNNLFPTIPSYYELIDKLNELEHLPYYDYQRKKKRNLENKKRTINKANEIIFLIERYKNIETKLIDAKCDRNNTINIWFDCLTNLNNII